MKYRCLPRLAVAAMISFALAACGAGGAGSHGSSSSPILPASAKSVSASITIKLPTASAASTASATKRSPAYVAAQSRSALLAFAPGAGCTQCTAAFSQGVSLTAPVCTAGTCTIPFNVLPGSYAASLTFYDGVLDPSGHPTGNALSEATSFPVAIATGQANVIGVVLSGVPVSIVQTNTTPSVMYLTTRSLNSQPVPIYRILAPSGVGVIALAAKDADGNVIAGPGAPTWTVSVNNAGFTSYTAAVSGNSLSITAPATRGLGDATVTIDAVSPGCADPSASCVASTEVGMPQLLAVADSAAGHVQVWPIGAAAPIATITAGVNGPNYVAFSPDGTLFVSNIGSGVVTVYAPPYTTNSPTILNGNVNGPGAIVVDPSGDLFIANSTPTVTIYAKPYTGAPIVVPTTGSPTALALDLSSNLWIATTSNVLNRLPPPYTGAFDQTIGGGATSLNGPDGLAVDAFGNVLVANGGANDALRFDPPYSPTNPPTITMPSTAQYPIGFPAAVGIGTGSAIFIGSSNGVGTRTSNGIPIAQIGNGDYSAAGFIIDIDGVVWVAAHGTGAQPVGIPPPYDGTNVQNLEAAGSPYTFIGTRAVAIY